MDIDFVNEQNLILNDGIVQKKKTENRLITTRNKKIQVFE